jgi:molybdate transport system regulatory protein
MKKNSHLSIRLDLANGRRIGPGKIALLEAIRDEGSISAAARHLGMAYRTAWLLVEQINEALREPAVTTATGGQRGGGATVTSVGEQVIALYRAIEELTGTSAREEFQAISRLVRQSKRDRA